MGTVEEGEEDEVVATLVSVTVFVLLVLLATLLTLLAVLLLVWVVLFVTLLAVLLLWVWSVGVWARSCCCRWRCTARRIDTDPLPTKLVTRPS